MHTLSLLDFAARLGIGLGCGALIRAERQWRARIAGLRTNARVAAGTTPFVLYAVAVADPGGPTRVASYAVSGIGFLGGSVILRDGFNVRGLGTAATLWCSAAVGVLAASRRAAFRRARHRHGGGAGRSFTRATIAPAHRPCQPGGRSRGPAPLPAGEEHAHVDLQGSTELLPASRTSRRALRAQAKGLFCAEGAVELLIGHQRWLCRDPFVGRFVRVGRAMVGDRLLTAVDWSGRGMLAVLG
jgi:hypothetical protein